MATLLLAALAGGSSTVALRLAGSMLALQISIGALNDLVDADLDRGRKPGKPIPRGVVTTSEAAMVAIIGLAVGLALSAPSGAPTVLVAAAGAGCGYAYDLRLSRTGWSWLPLAAALPLVPLYAWLGATGTLPGELVAIMPAGLLAGAALALANGLADLERDRAAGTAAAVVRIGPTPAWALHTTALGGAVVIAFVATGGFGGGEWPPVVWRGPAMAGGVGLIAVGAALVSRQRPMFRERGWELEAIGVAVLAVAWIGGLSRV